jgi:hypothetical protein
MKRLILLNVLLLIVLQLNAQNKTATADDIARFLKSKTYIVLEDDPFSAYNAFVESHMKGTWTITPYEVISIEEFENKCGDPNSSFMLIAEARFSETKSSLFRSNTDLFDNSDTYNYDIINLVMGDKSKDINKMVDLAIVPIAYTAIEDDESYGYRYGVLINFMQYYVRYCDKNPGKDIRELEKDNAGKIKNYELWVTQDQLAADVNTLEKIKKVYPYPVKITSKEEIEKAILEKNPKVAIIHKVGPEGSLVGELKCWKFVVCVSDGNPLYFDSHKIISSKPDAFLEDDFKNLAK